MCNLYSVTKGQNAIVEFTRALRDVTGNMPTFPGIFPNYEAPIVRNGLDGVRELTTKARWGMPTPQNILMQGAKKKAVALEKKAKQYDFKELLRMEKDDGVTNIRNVTSKHWTRWLDVPHRCVVPFTSFSEFNRDAGGDVWFAFDETRPLAAFAGIWVSQWTSVRKVRDGETTSDLFGFLTTASNEEVGKIHPKAMPVILTTQEDIEIWMTAPAEEAVRLQRPLPDGALKIVAVGEKEDRGEG
ncbi:SOS response-associated peptidase [Rhodoplanes sp. Z2-YC6860]|uniref:SOS response-associated peptidase n=1 Tax=Rhodoplanes sp. Z2-YC6860 TaxID=674703 RepID=UPI00078C3D1C|nr:SOS response-associated peptidase family protein [Rhodoplanes sp. Z2-YC6860]AMN44733.1 hypothetical protein RHPLAN_63240 [Rhodoplanes sp. Z2-YC6860]